MLRIEDFKSRMQEIKQYKSNTGKGYWDWKAQSLADGGEDTTELDIPVDDETRKKLIERNNATSFKRGNLYTDEQLEQIRYKDSLRNEEINRQVDLVMSAMQDLVDTKSLSKSIQTAQKEQERENIEKLYPYKLMLNSLATLGELGSAGYMLGKGAKTLGLISKFGSDTGQIAANTIGAISDGYQLMTTNNNKEKLENAIELPADVAGIIGGTNWFRGTKLFGAYGNKIDNILDWAGYTAAGYDGIIKPIQGIFNFFNDKYKIEQ